MRGSSLRLLELSRRSDRVRRLAEVGVGADVPLDDVVPTSVPRPRRFELDRVVAVRLGERGLFVLGSPVSRRRRHIVVPRLLLAGFRRLDHDLVADVDVCRLHALHHQTFVSDDLRLVGNLARRHQDRLPRVDVVLRGARVGHHRRAHRQDNDRDDYHREHQMDTPDVPHVHLHEVRQQPRVTPPASMKYPWREINP